jgi:uncharacterized membrane protein
MADDILPDRRPIEDLQAAIRHVGLQDVGHALALGLADFRADPMHRMFVALIYPVVGLGLGWVVASTGSFPLLYPIAGGFALLGPFAGVGLYEISRRRELGVASSWLSELAVFRSKRIAAVMELGVLLAVVFVLWMATANALYGHLVGGEAGPDSVRGLFRLAVRTRTGWTLCAVGTGAGFLFAAASFCVGVVSFPLLLDRDLGGSTEEQVATAVETSVRAVIANPVPMAAWALILTAGVAIGFLTALVGFIAVIPILGHATWHLYRSVVV